MIAASLRSTAWFATTILRGQAAESGLVGNNEKRKNNRNKYLSSEWFSLDQTGQ
jgi:hypothetical protein